MQKLTSEQAAIVTAYTETLCGSFHDFHVYAEAKLGRPISISEFASKDTWAELKAAAKADFLAICAEASRAQR